MLELLRAALERRTLQRGHKNIVRPEQSTGGSPDPASLARFVTPSSRSMTRQRNGSARARCRIQLLYYLPTYRAANGTPRLALLAREIGIEASKDPQHVRSRTRIHVEAARCVRSRKAHRINGEYEARRAKGTQRTCDRLRMTL